MLTKTEILLIIIVIAIFLIIVFSIKPKIKNSDVLLDKNKKCPSWKCEGLLNKIIPYIEDINLNEISFPPDVDITRDNDKYCSLTKKSGKPKVHLFTCEEQNVDNKIYRLIVEFKRQSSGLTPEHCSKFRNLFLQITVDNIDYWYIFNKC